MHLHLVTGLARPYPHGRDNLGIPIVQVPDLEGQPERATVGAVYDFLVDDLTEAGSLMGSAKPSSYGSKEAALALLSRLHLSMQEDGLASGRAPRASGSGR